jgi:hypothetical protein
MAMTEDQLTQAIEPRLLAFRLHHFRQNSP